MRTQTSMPKSGRVLKFGHENESEIPGMALQFRINVAAVSTRIHGNRGGHPGLDRSRAAAALPLSEPSREHHADGRQDPRRAGADTTPPIGSRPPSRSLGRPQGRKHWGGG